MDGKTGDAQRIMDELSGMVTMDQAQQIAAGGLGGPYPLDMISKRVFSAQELSELIANTGRDLSALLEPPKRITVKDRVYRIFNPIVPGASSEEYGKRILVLGSIGNTLNVTLTGKNSDLVDLLPLERGDAVTIKGLYFERKTSGLITTSATSIIHISQSPPPILDYPTFQGESGDADIVGRVIEAGQKRSIRTLGSAKGIDVLECKISDGRNIADVTLWGSCAAALSQLPINCWIKIEFCSIKRDGNSLRVVGSDLSRIAHNSLFAQKTTVNSP